MDIAPDGAGVAAACLADAPAARLRYVFLSVTLAGAVLCVASLFHAHLWVLFYPVVVNLVMLVVFGARCGHPCR